MSRFHYGIFGYAIDDLQRDSDPFLIVFWDDTSTKYWVKVFERSDWKRLISAAHTFDVGYIDDFIWELSQQGYVDTALASSFFDEICRLDVGPIRAKEVADCDPDRVVSFFKSFKSDSASRHKCSESEFSALLAALSAE